jgi:hypothetical protein
MFKYHSEKSPGIVTSFIYSRSVDIHDFNPFLPPLLGRRWKYQHFSFALKSPLPPRSFDVSGSIRRPSDLQLERAQFYPTKS